MNYYQALELQKDGEQTGKFHYTRINDGRAMPIGYCAIGQCDHNSKIEASDCYRNYLKNERNGLAPGGFPMDQDYGSELETASSY